MVAVFPHNIYGSFQSLTWPLLKDLENLRGVFLCPEDAEWPSQCWWGGEQIDHGDDEQDKYDRANLPQE